ncbi:hypothetical protein RRG08_048296 [Elysia crispata]|uniref:Uncharacterized protein n=1 Tax=Elysia crispata TaxID=231223 RepID=A0AAE0ZU64_9GAST|nr:hypothetical protein RRG08_048296 [Elysia crispata]
MKDQHRKEHRAKKFNKKNKQEDVTTACVLEGSSRPGNNVALLSPADSKINIQALPELVLSAVRQDPFDSTARDLQQTVLIIPRSCALYTVSMLHIALPSDTKKRGKTLEWFQPLNIVDIRMTQPTRILQSTNKLESLSPQSKPRNLANLTRLVRSHVSVSLPKPQNP